jgi:hypothetical protein
LAEIACYPCPLEEKVSCYEQDQELDRIDFETLRARLRQDSVHEKTAARWAGLLLTTRET